MTRDRSSRPGRAGHPTPRASATRPPPPSVAGPAPTPAAAGDAGEPTLPVAEPLELAAGYRLLAELFAAEPDDELLALATAVPALAGHATAEAARRYTDVFVINAYPFASVYLQPDAAIDGERAGYVRGVLETLGLEADPSVAADHIAVLLAALAALLEREAADADALQIERARHAQRALLAEHLLPWAPHFLDAVERVDHGLYRAAAALAHRLLGENARRLFTGRADALPPRASRPPGQTDPGAHGGAGPKARLTRLASPARCGFFLSRTDIVDLAAALGLAIRFGGRSFMLESVAQAAAQRGEAGALEAALVRFALGRRAVLEGWTADLPVLAPLWRAGLDRIDATIADWQAGGAANPDAVEMQVAKP